MYLGVTLFRGITFPIIWQKPARQMVPCVDLHHTIKQMPKLGKDEQFHYMLR